MYYDKRRYQEFKISFRGCYLTCLGAQIVQQSD